MTHEKRRAIFLDEKNGHDKNEGSETDPVQTLQRAEHLAQLSTADIMLAEHTEDGIEWKVRARSGEGL